MWPHIVAHWHVLLALYCLPIAAIVKVDENQSKERRRSRSLDWKFLYWHFYHCGKVLRNSLIEDRKEQISLRFIETFFKGRGGGHFGTISCLFTILNKTSNKYTSFMTISLPLSLLLFLLYRITETPPTPLDPPMSDKVHVTLKMHPLFSIMYCFFPPKIFFHKAWNPEVLCPKKYLILLKGSCVDFQTKRDRGSVFILR